MVLAHLLYISDAVLPISPTQLEAIRDVAVSFNAEQAITGVLFYSAGHFVQLLEGDPGKIYALFEKIADDPRHENVRLLIFRPTQRRIFADWNMGLLDLDHYDAERKRDLDELVSLAGQGNEDLFGTPVELDILSRFCMLLPAT